MTLIRFDENISYRIPLALRQLRLPTAITLEIPEEVDEAGLGDVDWISSFARRGGRCVVSGDEKMRDRPPERAALEEARLVAIFPPEGRFWTPLGMFGQAAYLTRWFPVIAQLAQEAELGAHFRLPQAWNTIHIDHVKPLPRVT